jgi:hypothetical protein
MKLPFLARLLALGAGALDFTTGLGLVFLPAAVLPLMRVPIPADADALVFLRFVGAFVAAVGASYLWAWLRRRTHELRAVFTFTIFFRLAAGSFSAVAIARGWLSPAWLSVPLTDFGLVAAQLWLLRQPIWTDETARL